MHTRWQQTIRNNISLPKFCCHSHKGQEAEAEENVSLALRALLTIKIKVQTWYLPHFEVTPVLCISLLTPGHAPNTSPVPPRLGGVLSPYRCSLTPPSGPPSPAPVPLSCPRPALSGRRSPLDWPEPQRGQERQPWPRPAWTSALLCNSRPARAASPPPCRRTGPRGDAVQTSRRAEAARTLSHPAPCARLGGGEAKGEHARLTPSFQALAGSRPCQRSRSALSHPRTDQAPGPPSSPVLAARQDPGPGVARQSLDHMGT